MGDTMTETDNRIRDRMFGRQLAGERGCSRAAMMVKRSFSQQWIIDCRNKFWPADEPMEVATGGPPVLSAIAELIEQVERLTEEVAEMKRIHS